LNEFLRTEGQKGLALPISLKHEFPNEWYHFLNPAQDVVDDPTLTMNLGPERFPFIFHGTPIVINKVEVFVKVNPGSASDHNESTLQLYLKPGNGPSTNPQDFLPLKPWNGLLRATIPREGELAGQLGNWTLTGWNKTDSSSTHPHIDPKAIEDILMVWNYSI
jgi:hypothetical protein